MLSATTSTPLSADTVKCGILIWDISHSGRRNYRELQLCIIFNHVLQVVRVTVPLTIVIFDITHTVPYMKLDVFTVLCRVYTVVRYSTVRL